MAYQDTLSELLLKDRTERLQTGASGIDLEGAISAIYSAEANRAEVMRQAAAQERFRQEYLDMQKSQAKGQNLASMIGGGAQLLTGLSSIGALGTKTSASTGLSSGLGGAGSNFLAGLYSTPFTAADVAGVAAGIAPSAELVGSQALADAASAAVYGGATPAAGGGILGSGIGLTGALGAGVGGFAGSYLGHQIGGDVGGVVGGIAGGALMGSILPGVGTIVGGIIGGVTSLFGGDGGSVICDELHRQGLMDDGLWCIEREYCRTHTPTDVYLGYRTMADPVVKVMRKSRLVSKLIAPFGNAFAQECSHRAWPKLWKSSWLGCLIIKAGFPLCRWVWNREVRKAAKSIGVM